MSSFKGSLVAVDTDLLAVVGLLVLRVVRSCVDRRAETPVDEPDPPSILVRRVGLFSGAFFCTLNSSSVGISNEIGFAGFTLVCLDTMAKALLVRDEESR